ncbi:hypothetical protein VE02_02939 [Pseudogymnoascus sp. 03VT05]|nr:hypothetical protein VE02_02939 [Pseudogymnoascus sp. 03VT05]
MSTTTPSDPSPSSSATPNYSAFQTELYTSSILHGVKPLVTTDPNKLEDQARAALPLRSYNYVAGGAGERATMDANRQAFRRWALVPRMLRDTSAKKVGVELFGVKYDSPILMAPVGVQAIFHKDREIGLAKACADIGVPYIMSTAASSTIEEVASASGSGHRWFQLYWPSTDAITRSLLTRAKNSGFSVLVVTLDTWSLAWRPADLDEGYIPFFEGVGNAVGFSDPVYRAGFAAACGGATPEEQIGLASAGWVREVCPGRSRTWEDLKMLRGWWGGKIVLKGIQHVDDAKLAVEAGMDGIVVSNHGGRQVDGAIGSLEVLPEIAAAVGKDITVLFDSGIRTGVDVIKALSLGAQAVLVGRPAVYGFAVGGAEGAKQVLRGLLADFEMSLGLAGIDGVEGCKKEILRRVEGGGGVRSSN